ncbi:STAS/SEC14 domain-containing protein [Neptunomonas marina]|uniref:STAS/SEC14 domain-containing protein n=1 Tax=Neptunomonas marina TaxID=1815562 RepID=A0A437Q4X9_9GAMM|nr:STAS/SEC14 domain-containing protein [Neptunomonas marina]RVU29555.1 STAS/SEC14 domain-containing protein [Neptunomonas marina]
MLSVLPETAGDLIVVQASDQLTADDYQSVLVPEVEEKLKSHPNVRVVIYFDPSFTGMELGAIWEDAKLGMAHANDFYRLAVVGGPDWAEWATALGNHLVKGEARHFSETQYLQAMHWVNDA